MSSITTLRTCENGHQFYKSSDCPTCPKCEEAKKDASHFSSVLSAPARRALESIGIAALEQLAGYTEKELMELHGIGKTTIPKLNQMLAEKGMRLKGKS